MVDIRQRALGPFEHHLLAVLDRVIQQYRRIRHKRSDQLSHPRVLLVHLLRVQRLGPEQRVRNRVLLIAGVLDVRPGSAGFSISTTRSPLRCTLSSYAGPIPRRTIVPIFVRPGAVSAASSIIRWYGRITCARFDTKSCPSTGNPASLSFLTSPRNAAGSNTTTPFQITPLHSRPQHATGNQLEHELLAADDDRMPGIVAARIPRHDGKLLRQYIHNLALALIAPLGTQNDRWLR